MTNEQMLLFYQSEMERALEGIISPEKVQENLVCCRFFYHKSVPSDQVEEVAEWMRSIDLKFSEGSKGSVERKGNGIFAAIWEDRNKSIHDIWDEAYSHKNQQDTYDFCKS